MKIDKALDFIQMRDGSSFIGSVLTKTFALGISGSTFHIERKHIISIETRHRTGLQADRVHTKDGSQLVGNLLSETVDCTSDELGKFTLNMADVLVIQFVF